MTKDAARPKSGVRELEACRLDGVTQRSAPPDFRDLSCFPRAKCEKHQNQMAKTSVSIGLSIHKNHAHLYSLSILSTTKQ